MNTAFGFPYMAILGLSSAMRRQKHESLSIVPYEIGKGLNQWIGLQANLQENPFNGNIDGFL